MSDKKSNDQSVPSGKRRGKPVDIVSDGKVNRFGTFLHQNDKDYSNLLQKAKTLLENAAQDAHLSADKKEIIEKILIDISAEGISKNLNVEGPQAQFSISSQEIEWMERQPEVRWVDYLVYRYEFRIYPKIKKLRPFPIYLLIEPTSVCNLRCIMCFQVDTTFTKKDYMGHMDWDLFKKVADQAKEGGAQAITLASRGEPTLHPKFGEMLRYLHKIGIMDLKINTNATRLDEKLSRDILDSEVNEIVFSVDAGTKETYEEIRVGGKFDQVVANIDRFNQIRTKDYPNSPTVTRISGVKVRDDQDEQQMQEFWSQYVDQVTIKRATPRWDSYNNPMMHTGQACSQLWERMYVWYDGKVNPCDFDYKSYLSPGNAKDQSLADLWNGEAYQKLRKDHLEKRRDNHNPCDRCPLY